MTHLLLSSIYLDFYRFLYTSFTQQSSSLILTDFCYQSIKIIHLPSATLVILPTIFIQLFDWAAKDVF